jgi:hypothetical protein
VAPVFASPFRFGWVVVNPTFISSHCASGSCYLIRSVAKVHGRRAYCIQFERRLSKHPPCRHFPEVEGDGA